MTRPLRNSERRAMADALRHMKESGVRLTDLRHGSGATHAQIERSLDRIILPGRDGIGAPPAGVVSPRQNSSLAGGKTSQLAGCKGADAPLAPTSFPVTQHGADRVEQRRTGNGFVGVDWALHGDLHVVAVGTVDDAGVLSWQLSGWHPVSDGEVTP